MRSLEYSEAFSPNYISARNRFREALTGLGCHHEAHSINQVAPSGEELTIDVVIRNVPNASRVVVISSGLHGVEGFLGSAFNAATVNRQYQIIQEPLVYQY